MVRKPEKTEGPSRTIVISGGGAASIFVIRGIVHDLTERGQCPFDLRIVIVEPRKRVGVGAAWDETHNLMLANMQTSTLTYMGGVNATGDGFDIRRLVPLFPSRGGDTQPYLMRRTVGKQLHKLYEETFAIARGRGITIEHVQAKTTGIVRGEGGFRVCLSSGKKIIAECVVLALGLLSVDRFPDLAGVPGYYANPWNLGERLNTIRCDQRVGIVGMGPTGIDCVLRLLSRDFNEPMLAVSRQGQLPAVRPEPLPPLIEGQIDRIEIRRLAAESPLTPREIDLLIIAILERFRVTRAHRDAQYRLAQAAGREPMDRSLANSGNSQPLFEALKTLDDLASTIWRCASQEGRTHIMKYWEPRHRRLSFAVPPANADAVLTHLDSGRLKIRGGLRGIKRADGRFHINFVADKEKEESVAVDIVINATGFDGPLALSNNALVRSLLAQGLICEGRYGGAQMNYETGEVVGPAGRRIDGLFIAGGSLTRTAGYLVNALSETSEHGIAVGMACVRYLHSNAPDSPLDRMVSKNLAA